MCEREIKRRERERERERKRERLNVILIFFGKCNWEIRTDNPSLAVKILNDTPRPNVPSQKAWLKIASDNHSRIFTTRERDTQTKRKKYRKNDDSCTFSVIN